MRILTEKYEVIEVTSLQQKMDATHFWIFDYELFDYTLAPLEILTEITLPTITLRIKNSEVECASIWNILTFSEETQQLDLVDIDKLSRIRYNPVIYNMTTDKLTTDHIFAIEYSSIGKVIVPVLKKTQMLCHPLNSDEVVCFTPSDNYKKYLEDKVLMDLIP